MKSSIYSLSSLVKQTAQVGIIFLIMLLLTGGRPSGFVVGSTACFGLVFVIWGESKRRNNSAIKSLNKKNY
ncbi:hypothetical protein [Nostoc sp. KVJ20]|uniref:hypothetical protein n=1 Tax=Nostoc sp. KVJ20 TaxID=457944 RepID=UPI00159F2608|nr:hypothetical protein [Nostoc sp. KVJ20]